MQARLPDSTELEIEPETRFAWVVLIYLGVRSYVRVIMNASILDLWLLIWSRRNMPTTGRWFSALWCSCNGLVLQGFPTNIYIIHLFFYITVNRGTLWYHNITNLPTVWHTDGYTKLHSCPDNDEILLSYICLKVQCRHLTLSLFQSCPFLKINHHSIYNLAFQVLSFVQVFRNSVFISHLSPCLLHVLHNCSDYAYPNNMIKRQRNKSLISEPMSLCLAPRNDSLLRFLTNTSVQTDELRAAMKEIWRQMWLLKYSEETVHVSWRHVSDCSARTGIPQHVSN
jgi:hypothetical protein